MRQVLIAAVALLLTAGCLGDGQRGTDPGAGPSAVAPPVPVGPYRFDDFARVLTDGALQRLPKEIVYLPSALDGVDIEVTLWRPDTPDVVPVLVDAGPYYEPAGAVPAYSAAAGYASEGGHIGRLLDNFLPHGYAVAAIAVRGTAGSGGCMDLMGPLEVADLDQAITWLGEQGWSNGNVAMLGKSYDGSTPWMVAGTGNPHLKTIVPMSGVPDMYELMFRNGTSEARGPFLLNDLYYSFALREPSTEAGDTGETQRRVRHTAEGIPCTDHIAGQLAAASSGAEGSRDMLGYWAERNLKPAVAANYHGSILLVQGLQDWNVDPGLNIPWIEDLNRSSIVVHQMLGQWGHSYPDDAGSGANMRWDWAELELRWFDYWLKGKGTVADLGPAVQVLDASDHWRTEDHFPPRDATWTTYNLSAGGQLTTGPGAVGTTILVPVPAAALSGRPSAVPGVSADFTLPPQEEDLLISGLPKVHVTVTPSGATGSVAAWLYSVAPDGAETRIGWTMINLRFADGTTEAKTVMPNQPILLRMEIQPMDAVVPAGHHLLLRIWEFYDDAGVQSRLPAVPPSSVTLGYGMGIASALALPTIERPASAYFTPPQSN
ncbi:MAG TPA: CocE/NonD family hydrolase [Candidatus Thermoplasmatota archaeon]|nr:CocE/NonD family hydrolase [Candidatus Thermoplasmatota archaeon]